MTIKQFYTIVSLLLFAPGMLFSLDSLNQRLLDYARAHPPTQAISLEEVVANLSTVAATDDEKAEIVFYWIAEHIQYEFESNVPTGETLDLNKVIRQQKANVQTFSQLYREMCVMMGLTCHIIPGYVRLSLARDFKYYDFTGRVYELPERPFHTWNAVKIRGDYYFLDISLGSGLLSDDTTEVVFIKKYDLEQVLERDKPFTVTHLPADPRWQMRTHPMPLKIWYTDLSHAEKVQRSQSSAALDYVKEIAAYEEAGEAHQRLMRLKSSYDFYSVPFNARQLADAFYNMAYVTAQADYTDQRMINARRNYQQAIDLYRELEQTATVKQLLEHAQQGITYVNYRLKQKQ